MKTGRADVLKLCRAIFNKITKVDITFHNLLQQINGLIVDAKEWEGIVELFFHKSTNDAIYMDVYALFAYHLAQHNQIFKKGIIMKCQNEYETNVLKVDITDKLQPFLQKINATADPIERAVYQGRYDAEKRNLIQKSISIIRFLGTLYTNRMLTGSIMKGCIEQLRDPNSELKLECLCNLLTIIDLRLEHLDHFNTLPLLNDTFKMLLGIANLQIKSIDIPVRLRCLILNVIAMRKNNWLNERDDTANNDAFALKQNKSKKPRNKLINKRKNDPKRNGSKNAMGSVKDGKSTEHLPNLIGEWVNSGADVRTIQQAISQNLAGVDADDIRKMLRAVLEHLMEEKTLESRGSGESVAILQSFFELLEK